MDGDWVCEEGRHQRIHSAMRERRKITGEFS